MEKEENKRKNEMIVVGVATKMGWRVAASGDFGIQFEKKPRLSVTMLVVGSILCLVGIGVVLLLIAIADYFTQESNYIYVNRIELGRSEIQDVLERFSPVKRKTNQ